MEELYSIMRDFLEVECNQKALLHILAAAEMTYLNEDQLEANLVANGTKYYLTALQKDLRTAINNLDLYLAEKGK